MILGQYVSVVCMTMTSCGIMRGTFSELLSCCTRIELELETSLI